MEITTETQRAIIATERSRLPRVLLAEREKEMRDILVPLLFRDEFGPRGGRWTACDRLAGVWAQNQPGIVLFAYAVVDSYTLLLHDLKKHSPSNSVLSSSPQLTTLEFEKR